jgi:hypothetical protein
VLEYNATERPAGTTDAWDSLVYLNMAVWYPQGYDTVIFPSVAAAVVSTPQANYVGLKHHPGWNETITLAVAPTYTGPGQWTYTSKDKDTLDLARTPRSVSSRGRVMPSRERERERERERGDN